MKSYSVQVALSMFRKRNGTSSERPKEVFVMLTDNTAWFGIRAFDMLGTNLKDDGYVDTEYWRQYDSIEPVRHSLASAKARVSSLELQMKIVEDDFTGKAELISAMRQKHGTCYHRGSVNGPLARYDYLARIELESNRLSKLERKMSELKSQIADAGKKVDAISAKLTELEDELTRRFPEGPRW